MRQPGRGIDAGNVRAIMHDALREQIPGQEIGLFRPHLTRPPTPYADLDLAIISGRRLPLNTAAGLSADCSHSDLPYRDGIPRFDLRRDAFVESLVPPNMANRNDGSMRRGATETKFIPRQ